MKLKMVMYGRRIVSEYGAGYDVFDIREVLGLRMEPKTSQRI